MDVYTSRICNILRGKLLIATCCVLLYCLNVHAFKITVDSTKAAENGNYRTLEAALSAIVSQNILPAVSQEDTILFTDTVQRTYAITMEMGSSAGSIRFIGSSTNPDNFPIINHISGEWFNYFNTVNVSFERLQFTGTARFRTGQNMKKFCFISCIVKKFVGNSFYQIEGTDSIGHYFVNCLFVQNVFSKALIEASTWAGTTGRQPVLSIVNCTFDGNDTVFNLGGMDTAGIRIANCVFTNNDVVIHPASSAVTKKIVHSLTSEEINGYGDGCQKASSGYYIIKGFPTRDSPYDWRTTDTSGALGLGDTSGAPTIDIGGSIRMDAGGTCDAGCWDIREGVKIISQPESISSTAGETVKFMVKVSGMIPVTYKWNKIGETKNPVSESDTFETITTITDDSSRYYCIVSNPIDTVTTDTVLLRVYQKPTITDQPDTMKVYTGDSVMFSVTAIGGDLTYTWKKNGIVIPDANGPNYTIHEISADDSGSNFVCVIANKIDSVTSRTAMLRVISPAIAITETSNDTILLEGNDLVLTVDVSGRPPLTYKWYKVGDPTLLSSTSSYVKSNVAISDSGRYRCIVSNTVSVDSAFFTIGIKRTDKPNITYQSGPIVIVKTGMEVTLSVEATGREPLEYTWYKGNYTDASSVVSTMDYTLASALEDNSGNYFCVVSNEQGADTSDIITLTVSSSPFFNPLELTCTFVDPIHAKIRVENLDDLPDLPEDSPHVDTVGLWFDPLTIPSKLSSSDENLVKLPLVHMLEESGNVFDTIIQLPEPDDECRSIHFILVPIWRDPDTIISMVSSKQYKKLNMCATTTLENDLSLSVGYHSISDSIEVHIGMLSTINRDSLKSLIVEYALGTRVSTKDTIGSDDLPSGDDFYKTYHDERFIESEETLTVSVFWRGILGNSSSKETTKLIVGKPRPLNNARLFVDSTTSTAIFIHWEFDGSKDFDSIRILWGMHAISAYTNIDEEGISYRMFGPSVTHMSIDSLTPDRQYYCGLQVSKESVVSIMPTAAVAVCSTKTSPLVMIPNSIKLYEASFLADSNKFKLAWRIDTTQSGSSDSLETGIVWGIDREPNIVDKKNKDEILVIDNCNTDNEKIIAMKSDLRFMATYHFALLLRKKGSGSWTSATDSSCDTIITGKPVWQSVTYFEEKDSVVTAFNDVVVLKRAGDGEIYIQDTVLAFIPDSIDSGFKIVSKVGFDFKHDYASDPIRVGLTYDTTIVGKDSERLVRMYQYDAKGEYWSVLNDCTVDSQENRVYVTVRPNLFNKPFILLLDTLPPRVKFTSDTSAAVEALEPVIDTVLIFDNIVNCTVKLVYWGSNGKGGNSVFVKQCTSRSEDVYTKIPPDSFSVDRGIKAELVISDDANEVVCDISRRVNRSASDPMVLPAMKWAPVMTTAQLSNKNIEASLAALSTEKKWKYDSKNYRIFRWIDTSDALTKKQSEQTSNWVEYQSDISRLFDMVPGRVVWVKSRNNKNISLGKGETVSMKVPFEITLKANDWNDIALPYNINVRLGDIFNATSSHTAIDDSLLVYSWVKDSQTENIVPAQKYIPEMPGYDSTTTTLKYAAEEDGIATYTIFNTTQHEIKLRIPAIPEAFSTFRSLPKPTGEGSAKKKIGTTPWSIIVKARTGDGELPPVLCACNNETGKRIYPVAPSFGRQRLMLRDLDQQSFCGSIIQNNFDQGGFIFPILFENNADTTVQFQYTITSVTDLPKEWKSVIYDPSVGTNVPTSNTTPFTVAVTAEGGVYQMLIVGDSTYIASRTHLFPARFSLLAIYPNPCRGIMNIRFILPFIDVKRVDAAIYNPLGRRVWNKTLHGTILAGGQNNIQWKPEGYRSLSAGTYIVQLSAFSFSGQNLGTLRQRVLYIP